jgi:hypothetical protein
MKVCPILTVVCVLSLSLHLAAAHVGIDPVDSHRHADHGECPSGHDESDCDDCACSSGHPDLIRGISRNALTPVIPVVAPLLGDLQYDVQIANLASVAPTISEVPPPDDLRLTVQSLLL